jgi:hypothetical protein
VREPRARQVHRRRRGRVPISTPKARLARRTRRRAKTADSTSRPRSRAGPAPLLCRQDQRPSPPARPPRSAGDPGGCRAVRRRRRAPARGDGLDRGHHPPYRRGYGRGREVFGAQGLGHGHGLRLRQPGARAAAGARACSRSLARTRTTPTRPWPAYARELSAELGIEIAPAHDLAAAVRDSDVRDLHSSRSAFLERQHVRPGTFVAAVGATAGQAGARAAAAGASPSWWTCWSSARRSASCTTRSTRGVDTRGGARRARESTGSRPGRTSEQEITTSTRPGTALQDVAAAAVVHKAVANGNGVRLSLGE